MEILICVADVVETDPDRSSRISAILKEHRG